VTVFTITVPSDAAVGSEYGRFNGGYNTAQQPNRMAALSTTPCDFSSSLGLGAFISKSTTTQINYTVGVTGSAGAYYPTLKPGQTYYLNVKNLSCPAGADCNMYMDVYSP